MNGILIFFFITLTLASFPEWAQKKYFYPDELKDFKRYLDLDIASLEKEYQEYKALAYPPLEDSEENKAQKKDRNRAIDQLFLINNARLHKNLALEDFIVDLHGQTPKTLSQIYSHIMNIAEEQYEESGYEKSFAFVYFMTGRGKNSEDGVCKLKKKLDELLMGEGKEALKLYNPGIWGVKLNSPNNNVFDEDVNLYAGLTEFNPSTGTNRLNRKGKSAKIYAATNGTQYIAGYSSYGSGGGTSDKSNSDFASSSSTDDDDWVKNNLPRRKNFKKNSASVDYSLDNENSAASSNFVPDNQTPQSNNPWAKGNPWTKVQRGKFEHSNDGLNDDDEGEWEDDDLNETVYENSELNRTLNP